MKFSPLLSLALAPLLHTFGAALAFSAESVSKSRISLKGIDASQFRHPLDRDLTSFVKSAPFTGLAEEAIRTSLSLAEQSTRLDLLSSSVKVSPQQMPELYTSMENASRILDMQVVPELYVQSSSQANAFTLALQGRDNKPPIVVVTSALLDRCTDDEIEAIIGHELGHLKCSHSLYLTLGGLVSTPLRGLPLVGSQAEQLLQRWRLAAEYSCDRAALLVAQDVNVVAGAMLKLFAGTARATNTQAFIDQSREYEKLLKDANPIIRASIRMQQRTHPLPVKRVMELEKWFNSDEYKSILLENE
mmetsp:Transcript_3649/g.5692  ORF Transcript_3649/g.5692 Transcript_3649/m.5692 type:complete len:303 (-) Transcript_3649:101-1009(-)|eukprot:CAMPEP_0201873506 /NCGR_PEP_ID=MMETSP0902-20130614/5988_1 /ASSEMBLY_ACC=CAM_ASM_000551 /TAXON_ID=420261 /ORGANISM="Thalassiosira antarctica, Strain CCMP982" /LENGTH=302 /DNA_ID=CAMNT_0048400121 /DNA_START=403 /DNA_END=1311 /DNA_ORIENTATION=+